MAHVKLLVGRVGSYFAQQPGQLIEVDAAEAVRLLELGQAEAAPAELVETAVVAARAKAALRTSEIKRLKNKGEKASGQSAQEL